VEYLNIGIVVTIVLGLTQWLKERMELTGQRAEALSFAIGAACGGVYQYAITQPVTLQGWLAVVFVALLMALVPSGIFQFVMQAANKAASK
jgi:uncharacterized membrane protein YoaK (UPF0700 family)